MARTMSPILLVVVVVLVVAPLVVVRDAAFGGADAQAGTLVTELAPDYQPWANPLWTPPGPEVESLLFALQAAVGAGAIGYFFGLKRGERRAVSSGARSELDGLDGSS